MEYGRLVGTEEVQRAAGAMQDAARMMSNVSSNIQLVFEAHQRFLNEWLSRYEAVMGVCQLCHDDRLYCPRCRKNEAHT